MPTRKDQSEDENSDDHLQGHPLETFDLFTEYRIAINNLMFNSIINVVFLIALALQALSSLGSLSGIKARENSSSDSWTCS